MMTLPLVSLLLGLAVREYRWSPLAGLALIAGQFALLIVAGPQNANAKPDAPGIAQLPGYFAHQGPYMDATAYQYHLVLLIVALIGVLVLRLSAVREAMQPTHDRADPAVSR